MFKNLTIQQISFYIVLVLGAVNLVVILLVTGLDYAGDHALRLAILFFVGIVVSSLIVKFLLERYVFSKIKLIYKFIHDSKADKKEKKSLSFQDKSLEAVNAEVIDWAQRTEEQLESLRTLELYRKEYVGNVSHELKTPIFSIQGYLHTLLDGGIFDKNINVKYLERAAKNTERLRNIVEDLESISRMESGELTLYFEKFDLRSLVSDLLQDLQVIATERNTKLVMKQRYEVPYYVTADKSTIRQVLSNLIVNSIKYGKEGGTTTIGFFDMADNILVEVTDDGMGIAKDDLAHLFDRFYRVDKSRSRNEGGSGLGLSIVKHIIEAHNQTINVRSTEDVGSTFGFTLKKAK